VASACAESWLSDTTPAATCSEPDSGSLVPASAWNVKVCGETGAAWQMPISLVPSEPEPKATWPAFCAKLPKPPLQVGEPPVIPTELVMIRVASTSTKVPGVPRNVTVSAKDMV